MLNFIIPVEQVNYDEINKIKVVFVVLIIKSLPMTLLQRDQ